MDNDMCSLLLAPVSFLVEWWNQPYSQHLTSKAICNLAWTQTLVTLSSMVQKAALLATSILSPTPMH
eukprot:3638690-Ditylum_brightwellii.AAC.1